MVRARFSLQQFLGREEILHPPHIQTQKDVTKSHYSKRTNKMLWQFMGIDLKCTGLDMVHKILPMANSKVHPLRRLSLHFWMGSFLSGNQWMRWTQWEGRWVVTSRYWNQCTAGIKQYWVNISKISPTSHMDLCIVEKEMEELNLHKNSCPRLCPLSVKLKIIESK